MSNLFMVAFECPGENNYNTVLVGLSRSLSVFSESCLKSKGQGLPSLSCKTAALSAVMEKRSSGQRECLFFVSKKLLWVLGLAEKASLEAEVKQAGQSIPCLPG